MNPNQIPYDALDWLQIGVYFLALPIMAFVGALIGLLGRWRRGGVLWATNVGMLGGAVTCLTCGTSIWTLNQKLPPQFVDYFAADYRWQMLATTLAATSACALVAGIAWRLMHRSEEERPFAFSLRQLMILQFFALVGLGCWISLRLFVLQATDPAVYAQRDADKIMLRWKAAGWELSTDYKQLQIDLRGLRPDEIANSMALFSPAELKNLPHLNSVVLAFIDDSDVDLAPILRQPGIRELALECTSISDKQILQVAQSQVEFLTLIGGMESTDLSPLAQSKSLRRLLLQGKIRRESFNSVSTSTSIRHLMLYPCEFVDPKGPPLRWPISLQKLAISNSKLHPSDLTSLQSHPNLKALHATSLILNDCDLALLSTLPALERIDLAVREISHETSKALANLHANEVEAGEITLNIHDTNFTQSNAAQLKKMKKLRSIQLYYAVHGDDIFDELAQIKSLEHLEITCMRSTEEGVAKLVTLPNLTWLRYPESVVSQDFQVKFQIQRETLKLPRLNMFTRLRQPREQEHDDNENAP